MTRASQSSGQPAGVKSGFSTAIAELSSHPVLLALSGLTGVLSLVTGALTTLGLPPVLADSTFAVLIAICTFSWARHGGYWEQPGPSMLVVDPSGNQPVRKGTFRPRPIAVAVAAVLSMLFVWKVWPPVTHVRDYVRHGPWEVCGVAVAECTAPCLRLTDESNRALERCVPLLDETGYFNLRAPSLFIYKPARIVASCPGRSDVSATLDDAFFDKTCGSRKVLR